MTDQTFQPGDEVRVHPSHPQAVVWGAVVVADDGGATVSVRAVGGGCTHHIYRTLLRRPAETSPSMTTGDTLRAHAEELMSLPAEGVLCTQLFSALAEYVADFPGDPATLDVVGLETVSTGGGCDAWEAVLFESARQSVALVITDENLSHPECDSDPVSMGLYLRDAEGENRLHRWVVFDNVAEALDAVRRGFSGVVWTEGEA